MTDKIDAAEAESEEVVKANANVGVVSPEQQAKHFDTNVVRTETE